MCVTRTCLSSGARQADKPSWATKCFVGDRREAGSVLVACDILQDTGMSPVAAAIQCLCAPAAVSAAWSMSGFVAWSQVLPPVSCWGLFFHPKLIILLQNSEDLTKICPALLALLKTSYWLLISQGPCVSKKPVCTHGMHAFVSSCFAKHLLSFWMLCNPQRALY